jgi:hypothetical protein
MEEVRQLLIKKCPLSPALPWVSWGFSFGDKASGGQVMRLTKKHDRTVFKNPFFRWVGLKLSIMMAENGGKIRS